MTDKMVMVPIDLLENIDQIKESRDMAMNIAAYGDRHGESGHIAQLLDWLVNTIEAAPNLHTDDIAVNEFAEAMKAKLEKKRDEGRGGWDSNEPGMNARLSEMLYSHVMKGDPVDVANFAMMLYMRGETIATDLLEAAPKAVDEPVAWSTEDRETDKSATTYSKEVSERWVKKGWPVEPLYAAPQQDKAEWVKVPKHTTPKVNLDEHYIFHLPLSGYPDNCVVGYVDEHGRIMDTCGDDTDYTMIDIAAFTDAPQPPEQPG